MLLLLKKAKLYAERLKDKNMEAAPGVSEGAEAYAGELSVHAKR